MVYIITGLQISIFIITVVGFSIRIEHRLTKIETDVGWLKKKINPFCNVNSDVKEK